MTAAVLLAALAALAAGAALLEVARLPPRPGGGRGARHRLAGRATAPPSADGLASVTSLPARWSAAGSPPNATERLLDAAGRRPVASAAALAVRRRVGALLGVGWGGATALLVLPAPTAAGVAALAGAGGHALPRLLLQRAAAARTARLRDEVPEILDLLAAAMACGLPVRAALESTARWSDGELSTGVARAAAELGRGAGSAPTLARLVREHPAGELDAAVSVLARAREHGTPPGPPLRALATSARHARARRAMEHAARAAPRVQLVAALLLVPAALCVMGAAMVAGGGLN